MINIDIPSFFKERRKLGKSFPVGMVLFTGGQGKGKSLSQSRYVWQLQRDWNAKVYSATNYINADVRIAEEEIVHKILTPREERPTVFLLDEIQVLLDPDGSIDKVGKSQVRRAIQQQRKRKTSIIGTAQVLVDIDPIYRRQIAYVVRCYKFGAIQIEMWLDGETLTIDPETKKYSGKVAHVKIWKRHNEMFDLYDTYEVVGDKKHANIPASGVAPG